MAEELIPAQALADHIGKSVQWVTGLMRKGYLSESARQVGRRRYVTSIAAAVEELRAGGYIQDPTPRAAKPAPPPPPPPPPLAAKPAAKAKPPTKQRKAKAKKPPALSPTSTKADADRIAAIEKARIATIKRKEAELELQVKQGKYLPVDDIAAEVDTFLAELVADLEGIPARLKQQRPEMTVEQIDAVRKMIDASRRRVATVTGE